VRLALRLHIAYFWALKAQEVSAGGADMGHLQRERDRSSGVRFDLLSSVGAGAVAQAAAAPEGRRSLVFVDRASSKRGNAADLPFGLRDSP
jgi:hypothetical protein